MIAPKNRRRVWKYIKCSQHHLEYLRKRKWECTQSKSTDGSDRAMIELRIEEVSNNIDSAYTLL